MCALSYSITKVRMWEHSESLTVAMEYLNLDLKTLLASRGFRFEHGLILTNSLEL